MQIDTPKNANRTFSAPENWDEEKLGPCSTLPVRMDFYPDGPFGPHTILRCTSAWTPTPAELAILNHGGQIEVTICGKQPPMIVTAVEHPAPPEEQPHDAATAAKGLTINEDAHGMSYDEHGPSQP